MLYMNYAQLTAILLQHCLAGWLLYECAQKISIETAFTWLDADVTAW